MAESNHLLSRMREVATGLSSISKAPTVHTGLAKLYQASHVTPSPVKSYIEERRSDYSGVTRKSNACKAVTP